MKTIKIIAAVLLVSLASCTADDSKSVISEAGLTGTWNLESHTLNGEQMNNFHDRFTFTSDHKVTMIEANGQSTSSGTYILTGSDLKCVFTIGEHFTYRLHINSLTQNKLIWETTVPQEGKLIETYRK